MNTAAEQQTGQQSGQQTERQDLLATLAQRRLFLRQSVSDLTDEQAALKPTVSALCLGGLIKHVAATERQWVRFILEGAAAMGRFEDVDYEARANEFDFLPGETLPGALAEYQTVAERTEQVVNGLPDLDRAHPLPEAPWFEPGASWSARTVLLHLIGETAQHAGHADIIRETIDGKKSMG